MVLLIQRVICTVIVVGIMCLFAVYGFVIINRIAYKNVTHYDARSFYKAQEAYYLEHDDFLGSEGDVISGVPGIHSTITVPYFEPSKGVILRILSIDDEHEPFTFEISLQKLRLFFAIKRTTDAFELVELGLY